MAASPQILFLTIFVLFTFCFPGFSAAALRISVAASMTDAFKELIVQFSTQQPGIEIVANYGPSGGLAKQIYHGAPVDLYISANPNWIEYLQKSGRVSASTVRVFAKNTLVFVARDGDTTSLEGLKRLDRIGIGNPKNVPAGQYAKQALTNSSIYNQLLQAGKLVMAKDVRQALLYADTGETDGSFVYLTDSLLAAHCRTLFEVEEGLHGGISYPLALTKQGEDSISARLFYDFVFSNQGKTILKGYGFKIPPQ